MKNNIGSCFSDFSLIVVRANDALAIGELVEGLGDSDPRGN